MDPRPSPAYSVDCIWQLAINAAVTERHLVTLAAGFIAGWTQDDLAHIPETCRPARLRSTRDVQETLARLEKVYDSRAFLAEDRSHIERLLGFLEAIAERAIEIREAARTAHDTIARARREPPSSFIHRRI